MSDSETRLSPFTMDTDGSGIAYRRGRRGLTRMIVVLLALAALAFGCGDSGDGTNGAITSTDLVGRWVSNGGVHIDFVEDGSYIVAFNPDELATNPVESGDWGLQGSEFTWMATASSSPGCEGTTGRYDVQLLDEEARSAQFTVIGDDPCVNRASDLRAGPLRGEE